MPAQNELILAAVLDMVFESINILLKGQVDKRTMLDNLELILLTIDEAVSLLALSSSRFPFLLAIHGMCEGWDEDKGLSVVALLTERDVGNVSQLDHGHIMEMDASSVVSRVLMRGVETHTPASTAQQPANMGDITLSQALGMAKDSIFKSFLGH